MPAGLAAPAGGRPVAPAVLRRLMPPLLAALMLSAGPAAAAYEVEVDAPKPIKEILQDHLDLSRYRTRDDISPDQFNYMVETVGEQVRQFTSTEGYFDPQTTTKVDGSGDERTVHITVELGARTVIRAVDVGVTGPAASQSPERIAEIRAKWGLPVAAPFRQADWDKAKEDALVALQSNTYYGARLTGSQARIEPDEHAADLSARFASGPAYSMGPLMISGLRRYPEQIIRNVNPLYEGEPYRVERLLEFQRAIQNQPYFSNVQIDLGEQETTEDGKIADTNPDRVAAPKVDMSADKVTVPVYVRVREYPVNRLSSGVGYTTDTGAQVEGRYSYYNLFNRAWVFDSQARIEQKRQYVFGEIAMPPDSRTYRNSAYASYERTIDLESTDLTSLRTGLKRSRSRENYDTTISLDYYYDNLQPFGEANQLSREIGRAHV